MVLTAAFRILADESGQRQRLRNREKFGEARSMQGVLSKRKLSTQVSEWRLVCVPLCDENHRKEVDKNVGFSADVMLRTGTGFPCSGAIVTTF